MADPFTIIVAHILLAFVIFGIASGCNFAVNRGSLDARRDGWCVVVWGTVGYFGGGGIGRAMADGTRYLLSEIVPAMAFSGLLAGVLIGNLHSYMNRVLRG